jgi:hypothetical protein
MRQVVTPRGRFVLLLSYLISFSLHHPRVEVASSDEPGTGQAIASSSAIPNGGRYTKRLLGGEKAARVC